MQGRLLLHLVGRVGAICKRSAHVYAFVHANSHTLPGGQEAEPPQGGTSNVAHECVQSDCTIVFASHINMMAMQGRAGSLARLGCSSLATQAASTPMVMKG
jgi:hypothetical protein